jgi:hypothetical protein
MELNAEDKGERRLNSSRSLGFSDRSGFITNGELLSKEMLE